MATIEDLKIVYEQFCAFGRGASMDSLNNGGSTMDGGKWAKFIRDCGLLSGKVTPTEIDIIFNKVKPKAARRIGWNEFTNAVRLAAIKRYPSKSSEEAFNAVLHDVCIKAKGPLATSTTAVKNDAVLDRLTDVSGYTGAHKHRFDAEGKGRGLKGRDMISKTDTLEKLVNRRAGNVLPRPTTSNGAGGVDAPVAGTKRASVLTASEETLEKITNAPKKTPIAGSRRVSHPAGNVDSSFTTGSSSLSSMKTSTNSSKSSVFDRLTDSSGYTGAHKHRFNADGTGRGLNGRESIPKNGVGVYRGGDVKSLSQILRT